MTIADSIIILFFGLWTVATLVKHVPDKRLPEFLRAVFRSGLASWLIPSWNFFAPTPGVYTYHLLYRDKLGSGEISDWHEIRVPASRAWVCALWNPPKTMKKAVLDISLELIRAIHAVGGRHELLRLSIPYLTILTYVSGLPRLTEVQATQFALLQSSATSYDVLFLSDLHNL